MDIAQLRLHNQSLIGKKFATPMAVVKRLGAVQAQDFAAAKWALGMRMQNATDADVEWAFNKGSILRTHVMRPTWHFVPPQDIRWMVGLTASRVKALLAPYDRKLEISGQVLSRSRAVMIRALMGGKHLTRDQLAARLESSGIPARGQRLAHIVMHAELDAVICSGRRSGKQFTYALLEERVPQTKKLSRERALSTLVLRYFTSHGPAQAKDFAWWSGLTTKDVLEGLELVRRKLVQETVDGKVYWLSPDSKATKAGAHGAYLLSIYDEYTIAYRDRSALGGESTAEKLLSMGNALTAVMVMNGKIVGTWKRTFEKSAVRIALSPFGKLTGPGEEAFAAAALRYGKFLGLQLVLDKT